MIKVPFRGGCGCGEIRYECIEAPLAMVSCHCRDCQIASGSGYSPTLVMNRSAVKITGGQPSRFEKRAESGNHARREFCPTCGSPLFAASSAHESRIGVRAASLDDPSWFRAEADVWVRSAQPWDYLCPTIPKFDMNRSQRPQNQPDLKD